MERSHMNHPDFRLPGKVFARLAYLTIVRLALAAAAKNVGLKNKTLNCDNRERASIITRTTHNDSTLQGVLKKCVLERRLKGA
jgi:hypothetical protein